MFILLAYSLYIIFTLCFKFIHLVNYYNFDPTAHLHTVRHWHLLFLLE